MVWGFWGFAWLAQERHRCVTQAICFDALASRSAGLVVWVHRQCTDPKLLLCFDCLQDAIQLCLCVYAIVSLQDSDAMISLCVAQFFAPLAIVKELLAS